MYAKLQGYDLKQLKELVERNGWKNVHLSLDDIRSEFESVQQKNSSDEWTVTPSGNVEITQGVQPTTLLTLCPYCKRVHDNRVACPEYIAKSQRGSRSCK